MKRYEHVCVHSTLQEGKTKPMYEMWCWIIVLLQLCLALEFASGIMLTEVRVPKHTIKGHSVRLECHYDMEGEALYSVKWYKDGREFYRYVPRDDPPGTVFPLPGITLDLQNSTSEQVVLDPIDLSSSGKYRCEVSAEAPSFQTVSDHGEMLVVVLPEEDPYITGGKPRYQIGDIVRVNCTSGRSKPAVHLTWYINGEVADNGLVKRYEPIVSGPDRLETSVLGLEFRVKAKHFKRGDMKLKCLATISTVYWKSNEESVEGEKVQKAPMLESRRAVSSDTRADRVQAASNGASGNKYSSGLNFTLRVLGLLTAVSGLFFPWPSSSCSWSSWSSSLS
ncbi:beat protein [Anopheles darlingi]|uniref:Beat protein n=1 Tax=Anopheles darlingi TaxID=43151 RepID=W5JJP2_ANODA|nr:beat protein [Anopheles darlingi]